MVSCPVCKNPLPFFLEYLLIQDNAGKAVGLVIIVKVKLIGKEN
jgi:hypothetical protein